MPALEANKPYLPGLMWLCSLEAWIAVNCLTIFWNRYNLEDQLFISNHIILTSSEIFVGISKEVLRPAFRSQSHHMAPLAGTLVERREASCQCLWVLLVRLSVDHKEWQLDLDVSWICTNTIIIFIFFALSCCPPRILLSRVLTSGEGARFRSSFEVSPTSFRYYSSSVEYLTGTHCSMTQSMKK